MNAKTRNTIYTRVTKRYLKTVKNLTVLAALALAIMLGQTSAARANDYVVSNTADSGTGSLRVAIDQANSTAEDDTITFDPGVFATHQTINLDRYFYISPGGKVTINGPAAGVTLLINRGDPNDNYRYHFHLSGSSNLEISKLTLTGGYGTSGTAIFSSGTVKIVDSTISGNQAYETGGAIENLRGNLTVQNSTISGNSAGITGGGINNSGNVTFQNATVSGNSAPRGGGIFNSQWGTVTTLHNTIIANNDGGNCNNSRDNLAGIKVNATNSLISNGLGCVTGTNINNLTGNPNLGPLADNGGPTMTHALLPGSIAVNRGSNALIPAGITTDQRGQARIFGISVDIGSYEQKQEYLVNSLNNPGTGGCTPEECTLTDAILQANASGTDDTVTFDSNVFSAHQTITLKGGFYISPSGGKLTIDGPAAGVTISLANRLNSARRHFTVDFPESNLEIRRLTLTGGNVTNGGSTIGAAGGAIYNKGTVKIVDSTITGNSAGAGGGIENYGNLTVQNSTISGNSADEGGAIDNSGPMILQNSTISGNSARIAGGIFSDFNGSAGTKLDNTIIANSTGADCLLVIGVINAQYSLIEDGLGCVNGTNVGNLTGDPDLGPLQNNGGPTMTHALLPGSVAVNRGSNALIPQGITTDQRGQARIFGNSVDIGSYEYISLTITRPATVAGRVTDGRRGLNRAVVTLQAPNGSVATVLTDPSGRFEFSGVRTGQTYVITVTAKHYLFAPQTIYVNADVADLLLIGMRTTGGGAK